VTLPNVQWYAESWESTDRYRARERAVQRYWNMNPERNTSPRVTRCETAPAAARNLGWPVCNPIELCWLLLLYIPNVSFLWTQIDLPLNSTLLQHSFKSSFNGVTFYHLSWHKLVELLYCFSLSNSLSLLLSTTHQQLTVSLKYLSPSPFFFLYHVQIITEHCQTQR
jgi:hypothetical protein